MQVAEPAELTDEVSLIRAAQSGDAEAFCALGRSHQDRLLRQALALCGNSAAAEDLVAETMIEAWRCLPRFRGDCRFSTWLYGILLHRHQKAQRRAACRPVAWASLIPAVTERLVAWYEGRISEERTPAEVLVRGENYALVRDMVASLPPKQCAVLCLRFFEDASLEEIASVLGCAVGTVKSRLHHGLERLRRHPGMVNLEDWGRDTEVWRGEME